MFIYITTNLVNGKRYIGMCTRDVSNYIGSGVLIKKAINKYGIHNFKRDILEVCDNIETLSKAEEKWIQYYDAVNSADFYNLSLGGRGGNPKSVKEYWNTFTKEERQKMCESFAYSRSSGFKGRTHTEETKQLIGSKSVNRNWNRPTNYGGSNNPRARKAIVTDMNDNTVIYECLKDICNDYSQIPYSTLKGLVKRKNNYSEKWGINVKWYDV